MRALFWYEVYNLNLLEAVIGMLLLAAIIFVLRLLNFISKSYFLEPS